MTGSFTIDIEDIAKEIKEVARQSSSEEDLRQGVEFIIKTKIIEQLKQVEKVEIPYTSWRPPKARYEVTLVSGARLDALYGHMIIEYEKPGSFGKPEESKATSGFEKAVEQVKGYIRDHAEVEARLPRYFGVVLDGYKIGFVRYRQALNDSEKKGPFEVNRNTIAKLVEAIIGLRRKALGAEELLKDFGPESPVAREAIKTFYGRLLGTSPRTQMLFDDWRRVFSQVCAYSPEKIKGLEEVYGFGKGEADPEKLLFALHTYYALIMKLLAAEVASLYVATNLWSYLKALEEAYYKGHERLKDELRGLEEGGIFAQLKITNFLEADYFAWYLDEWDEDVAKCVMSIVNNLSNYDPSAAELEPERVKDLFKRLYQNLLPKKIRHDLGEYYTPDWLAELVLNEVGWTAEAFEKKAQESGDLLAPLDLRLLDPACGSGTFLVLTIARLRGYIEEHWVDRGTALEKVTKNVVGFDLNPLAVIASRTNYLVALGDMLRERGAEPIEIPIYLSDSILVERRQTLTGDAYILKTAVAEFSIPTSIVEKGLLAKALTVIEESVKGNYSSDEFRARLQREASLDESETFILTELFEMLSRLEKEGKNRIWTRVLKNSFAPFFAGKFDYVVGNPPWINWESLPEDYRRKSADLWIYYGLIVAKGAEAGLGAKKRDISMLFVYRCVDIYLVSNSLLGFVITQSIFKSDAGEGFRRFTFKGTPMCAKKVHDIVDLAPFEGAQNRTSLLIIKKGSPTTYPLPYTIWRRIRKGQISTDMSLQDVNSITEKLEYTATPVEPIKKTSAWMCLSKNALTALHSIVGKSEYVAYEGCNTGGMNGVFFINVLGNYQESLLVENFADIGKKKVRKVRHVVEPDLVYPLLRGRDVGRWKATPSMYEIVTGDLGVSREGIGVREFEMKDKYPKTYSYLKQFEKELKGRPLYKKYRARTPFYNMFNINRRTLMPCKVVWRYIATDLIAAVVSPIITDVYLKEEKVVIPDCKLMFVPCSSSEEAHFICALLNSSSARLVAKGYVVGTQISTHILEHIKIPRYDPKNPVHIKLTNLSKEAHQLSQQGREEELKKVEEEIDGTVAQLYGLTDDELKEIKESFAVLEGGEAEGTHSPSVNILKTAFPSTIK
jgi:hypothetical protein